QESLFFIFVFSVFLSYVMVRSTQSIVNLTLGLYLALLISLQFPFYDVLLKGAEGNAKTESLLMIIVFAVFIILSTLLFARLMPTDSSEPPFENFSRKIIYAIGATILVMAYSYHALPITEVITPGSPIAYLFESAQSFFWWLLAPLVILFFL
ncbi:MAG: hypothetical protein ACI9VM_000439, partial [Candidatus Azotimanducaceae bacterium]